MKKITLLAFAGLILANGCSKDTPIPAPTVTLRDKSISLEVGEGRRLLYDTTNETGVDTSVEFRSSNPDIAVVNNGSVFGKSVGEAEITAIYFETGRDVCKVTVTPCAVKGVRLNKSSIELQLRASVFIPTEDLYAHVLPDKAMNRAVKWSSSDETVATVNGTGRVTAVSEGECIVKAITEEGGFEAECKVKILPIKLEQIVLTPTYYLLEVGAIQVQKLYFYPETAKNKNVIWTSSDNSIASVDEYGIITALKIGEATITATTEEGGFTQSCQVKVAGVGDLIESNFRGTFTNFNGVIVGSLYLSIENKGSKTVTLISFNIVDSQTGAKIMEENFSDYELKKGGWVSKGIELIRVYQPIYTYVYECDGKRYTLSKKME